MWGGGDDARDNSLYPYPYPLTLSLTPEAFKPKRGALRGPPYPLTLLDPNRSASLSPSLTGRRATRDSVLLSLFIRIRQSRCRDLLLPGRIVCLLRWRQAGCCNEELW